MIRVSAPTRLHFGLFNDGNVSTGPYFGGLGLMLASPRVIVTAEIASEWSATGPNAERALEAAKRVSTRCHRVVVEQCPEQHTGLGVGTALALATATAVILAEGREVPMIEELARLVGRGRRSGIGMHGFVRGGYLHDAGKQSLDDLPQLGNRLTFPGHWRILLARPQVSNTWHGERERSAFARNHHEGRHRELAKPMSMAIHTHNFQRFAELLTEFNREAGKLFEFEQGGIYADPVIAETIETLQSLGCLAVGQSSWGPTVFAISDDEERLRNVVEKMRSINPTLAMEITKADDSGAIVSLG